MNVVKYLLARVATETIAGVTKICDNFRSLTPGALTDKVGKDIATELDSVWGGEYGGGRIEDTSVPKVVGKRYLGEDGKAYICKVASHINTPENYLPCNVVDNLDRIEVLSAKKFSVFYAGPTIPSSSLLVGTSTDGVIKLDYSKIPQGYVIVGHDSYCDTEEVENFFYGSIARNGYYRFKRLNSNKGFEVFAYAVKLK